MEELIRFIIIAVIFFRFVAWLNRIFGGTKKPNKKPSGNFMDEIQKQLKQFEEKIEQAQQEQQQTIDIPQSMVVKAKPKPVYSVPPSMEGQSLEITEAPYSNLEQGILDPIHQSKFKHHDITKDEIGDHKEQERVNILEDFDPKKAFIHSLIFDRKHFDL